MSADPVPVALEPQIFTARQTLAWLGDLRTEMTLMRADLAVVRAEVSTLRGEIGGVITTMGEILAIHTATRDALDQVVRPPVYTGDFPPDLKGPQS